MGVSSAPHTAPRGICEMTPGISFQHLMVTASKWWGVAVCVCQQWWWVGNFWTGSETQLTTRIIVGWALTVAGISFHLGKQMRHPPWSVSLMRDAIWERYTVLYNKLSLREISRRQKVLPMSPPTKKLVRSHGQASLEQGNAAQLLRGLVLFTLSHYWHGKQINKREWSVLWKDVCHNLSNRIFSYYRSLFEQNCRLLALRQFFAWDFGTDVFRSDASFIWRYDYSIYLSSMNTNTSWNENVKALTQTFSEIFLVLPVVKNVHFVLPLVSLIYHVSCCCQQMQRFSFADFFFQNVNCHFYSHPYLSVPSRWIQLITINQSTTARFYFQLVIYYHAYFCQDKVLNWIVFYSLLLCEKEHVTSDKKKLEFTYHSQENNEVLDATHWTDTAQVVSSNVNYVLTAVSSHKTVLLFSFG